MKRMLCAMMCMILLMTAGCAAKTDELTALGIDRGDFTAVSETDTHGGFHGDGMGCLVLDCSGNRDKAMAVVSDWKELPLSENLSLIVYGGERDGVSYAYNLAEQWGLPQIKNGWYRFIDRHSRSTDNGDDSQLLDRASMNFTLAVYDGDTDLLYVCELDT